MKVFQIIVFLGIFIIFGCKQGKEESSQINTEAQDSIKLKVEEHPAVNKADSINNNCVITNENQKLRGELFPFDFKGYRTAKLRKYFSENVTVDSTRYNNEGTTYTIYQFKEGSSSISFFVKPNEGKEPWFYLEESSIDNNLINFKNGIRIGMPRSEVYKALGIKENTCDTLHFEEGDLFTYYDFIFKSNRLTKINITPEE
jgi:hypothetical protein